MALEERLLRLMREREPPTRRRQPHHEQLQHQKLPSDPRAELAEVDLGVRARRVLLTDRDVTRHTRQLSLDLRHEPADADSDTRASCSSTSRCHTRRAVRRCLRGTSSATSASSHLRITNFHGPNAGDDRSATLRGGGVADAIASRTVRRCTPNRTANERMLAPSRCSLRIRSYISTLDSYSCCRCAGRR
jgi:hypothetical protein